MLPPGKTRILPVSLGAGVGAAMCGICRDGGNASPASTSGGTVDAENFTEPRRGDWPLRGWKGGS